LDNAGHLGGVQIKLKMGKDKEESVEEDSDENSPSDQETLEKDKEAEEKIETKKDVDDLRKVIKINPKEDESEILDRDSLEQKRAILQSIKDFDFHIKKNSEEINSLNKKLDSVTKDLDDLVSLYEIVSEQMNPFVGLSKVTKKRIEALENFTNEVDDLKNRMNVIESFAENAGLNLDDLREKNSKRNQELEGIDITENEWQEIISKMELSGNDVDSIIEKTLLDMELDTQIDFLINEYIENLII
jgi:flagellar protein FlaC